MRFLLFFVGFLEKRMKSTKFGNFRGLTQRRRHPTQQRRSTPRCGREEAWTSLGYTEASKAMPR